MNKCVIVLVAAMSTSVVFCPVANAQSTDEIRACVNSKGGMRILFAGQSCKAGETPLTWNVQGPQGPVGPGLRTLMTRGPPRTTARER